LSVLLDEKIKIKYIKESESNQTSPVDKFNRVDIFVENSHGELLIIEVQNNNEADYFLKMLYGVSKAITEHISLGDEYIKVRKVYHINIVYFKLGIGEDYVYRGSTEFRGIHNQAVLQLTEEQKKFFTGENRKKVKHVKDLYPEYYILCVEDFNDIAKSSLDEWIYYLKNNTIPAGFKAPGLRKAKKLLKFDKLSEQERRDYEHHVNQKLYERNSIKTAKFEGKYEGHAEGLAEGRAEGLSKGLAEGLAEGLVEGRAEGRAEGKAEREQIKTELSTVQAELKAALKIQESVVIKLYQSGSPVDTISTLLEQSPEQIIEILKRNGFA
jgi:predicted transposase/invertase (TIGR01784 family)